MPSVCTVSCSRGYCSCVCCSFCGLIWFLLAVVGIQKQWWRGGGGICKTFQVELFYGVVEVWARQERLDSFDYAQVVQMARQFVPRSHLAISKTLAITYRQTRLSTGVTPPHWLCHSSLSPTRLRQPASPWLLSIRWSSSVATRARARAAVEKMQPT